MLLPFTDKTFFYWGDQINGWKLYGVWFGMKVMVGVSVVVK
jgi:hypothetical protein